MGKVNYYITSHGKLIRKHNTVYFLRVNEDGGFERILLPINKIYGIYAYGRIGFSSGVVSFLSKKRVPIHFFNKYGGYVGTLYPRKYLLSGHLLVKQAEHYLKPDLRAELAKKIVKGSIGNMIRNLEYYQRLKGSFEEELSRLGELEGELDKYNEVSEIMGIEGNSRDIYYHSFNKILPSKFKFDKRTKRPPETMLNSLISFGNSLLYATVLNEIYNSQLDPTISYLHQPSERRFSLSLDISEIFKPIIVDRVIFKLINKKMIDEKHFNAKLNYVILNKHGKNTFLEAYEEKLKTTIKHRSLGRKVSIQKLLRLECYKLIKHLLEIKSYKPLVMWW